MIIYNGDYPQDVKTISMLQQYCQFSTDIKLELYKKDYLLSSPTENSFIEEPIPIENRLLKYLQKREE